MNEAPGSTLVLAGFPALAALAAGLFVFQAHVSGDADEAGGRKAARQAALRVAVLFVVPGALAGSGALAKMIHPPLFMPMMASILVGTVLVSRSALGRGIATGAPLALLVGAQGFRLPLELVMHEASLEGVMPPQMSFQGLNFDIVTGALALVLAAGLALEKVPRGVVLAWNVVGTALLANVVTVAVLSAPWFAFFGPDRVNTFVLHLPYTWLATVMVPFALFGHLTVFRALREGRAEGVTPRRSDGSPRPAGAHPPARA
ncbi:MAG TPA: hypothetical protein VHE30_20430 [Polyangiaceae bacterium]|nr:hypothetical protein [Polyangiaceae bacterium]